MDFVKFTKTSSIITCFFNLFCQQLICQFEKSWLQSCPYDFKIYYYRVCIKDIFFLFTSPKHLEALQNCRHASVSFTTEIEKQNRMSFLDVQIFREYKNFTISVYRKPTLSGVYTHFDSFLPSTFKFGTVYTLASYRCLRICSSWTKLHNKLVCLKEILLKSGYTEDFIN